MTDICLCCGEGCEMRNDCYRYRCKRDAYNYWMSPPFTSDGCSQFIELHSGMKLRSIEECEKDV